MASNFDLNTENKNNQKEHSITITYTRKCKKLPVIEKGEDFITVYSPKAFTLNPKESCIINLHCNISCNTELIDPWLSLLPTLKVCGLKLMSKTVTKKNEMEVMLQNISSYYTVKAEKHQVFGFIFLLGAKDLIFKTEYFCIYE